MQTEIIRDWFSGLSDVHQMDISGLLMPMLSDTFDFSKDTETFPQEMLDWLTPEDEFAYRTLGKALSFIHCFEHIFSSRFSHDGWVLPRQIFEKVLADPPSESMAKTARDSLESMPERQEQWAEIGKSWEATKASITLDVPPPREPDIPTIRV